MVEKIRKDAGKSAEPHYALIDSQSVKTVADNEKRGIDGGKKAKGRKRHAVIDTMGNLLGIVVHAANIHDTKSGILAAQKACKKYPSIQAFCADAGYRGTCIDEVKVTLHNSAARLAMSFPPSASCKFLDLPPVNLRNLHLHLTKNSFASRPPHLCGVTLKTAAISLQLRAEHHRRCEYLLSGSTRWRGESLLSQRSCRSCFLYFDCRVRSLMGKCRRKSLLRTITITKQRKRLYRALKLFQSAPEK